MRLSYWIVFLRLQGEGPPPLFAVAGMFIILVVITFGDLMLLPVGLIFCVEKLALLGLPSSFRLLLATRVCIGSLGLASLTLAVLGSRPLRTFASLSRDGLALLLWTSGPTSPLIFLAWRLICPGLTDSSTLCFDLAEESWALTLEGGTTAVLLFVAPGHGSFPWAACPASSLLGACVVAEGTIGWLAHAFRSRIEPTGAGTCCFFLIFYLLEV